MAQAKTLTPAEIEKLLLHINTRKYAARNRSMMLLTHWAGLRIGEVAGLRWSDVTTTDGLVKDGRIEFWATLGLKVAVYVLILL